MEELEIRLEGGDGDCLGLTGFMVVRKIHAEKLLNRKGV